MASIKLLLFTHKKLKNGTHPLVLQVIKDRKRKLISLGFSATAEQWDEEENLPNKKHPNYKELRLFVKNKSFKADKVLLDLENEDRHFTIDELVDKITNKDKIHSFYNFTENLISKMNRTGNTHSVT
ncbi:MAG: hypothetical protein HQ543_05230 [Bacteroidetes bacterium]|nr:hypothetical protein [Bacteroidota bacterium]